MTPQEAVAAAFADNRHWMGTHVGIVKFILSEEEPGFADNEEFDEVILANPDESRNAAKVLDAQGRNFQVQLSLVIPETAWNRAYGMEMDEAGVTEFLQNALFISTDHIAVTVHSITDQGK